MRHPVLFCMSEILVFARPDAPQVSACLQDGTGNIVRELVNGAPPGCRDHGSISSGIEVDRANDALTGLKVFVCPERNAHKLGHLSLRDPEPSSDRTEGNPI